MFVPILLIKSLDYLEGFTAETLEVDEWGSL